VQEKIG